MKSRLSDSTILTTLISVLISIASTQFFVACKTTGQNSELSNGLAGTDKPTYHICGFYQPDSQGFNYGYISYYSQEGAHEDSRLRKAGVFSPGLYQKPNISAGGVCILFNDRQVKRGRENPVKGTEVSVLYESWQQVERHQTYCGVFSRTFVSIPGVNDSSYGLFEAQQIIDGVRSPKKYTLSLIEGNGSTLRLSELHQNQRYCVHARYTDAKLGEDAPLLTYNIEPESLVFNSVPVRNDPTPGEAAQSICGVARISFASIPGASSKSITLIEASSGKEYPIFDDSLPNADLDSISEASDICVKGQVVNRFNLEVIEVDSWRPSTDRRGSGAFGEVIAF